MKGLPSRLSANRYERRLRDVRGDYRPVAAALADASARVRSSPAVAGDERRMALATVTAGVAVPFLLSYVTWILDRARRVGVERLYFLARDGDLLFEIARAVSRPMGLSLELRYLPASRATLNLASAGGLTPANAHVVLARLNRLNLTNVSQILHLDQETMADLLVDTALEGVATDCKLGPEGATSLIAALTQTDAVELIGELAQGSRRRTLAFLRQEGFFDDVDIGLVDVGGAGSQFRALSHLRSEHAVAPPSGYLACLDLDSFAVARGPVHERAGCRDLHVYLLDQVRDVGEPRFHAQVPFLELFSAARHGSVLDYRKEGDVWKPVTEEGYAEQATAWGWELVRSVALNVVEDLLVTNSLPAPTDTVPACLVENLRSFVLSPSRTEAAAWGAFPTTATGKPLAPPLNFAAFTETLRRGVTPPPYNKWVHGSRAQAAPPIPVLLQAGSWIRRRNLSSLVGS